MATSSSGSGHTDAGSMVILWVPLTDPPQFSTLSVTVYTPDKKADREAVKLLKKYDKARIALRKMEDELAQAANEFGYRRGHLRFLRPETMRIIMEMEGLIK